ncbi:HEAT repeat domain-containing protein [Streptomyces sp. NPDC058463]|uniref:HEAT repeat domain-containing protein n=1 Tax=Streptomyces sp. NPDC058463 TaxID=3346510 RepID=UPI003664422A
MSIAERLGYTPAFGRYVTVVDDALVTVGITEIRLVSSGRLFRCLSPCQASAISYLRFCPFSCHDEDARPADADCRGEPDCAQVGLSGAGRSVTDWSAEDTDLAVLTEVLVALGEHLDPRAEAPLLLHAGHPDARVRRAVAQGFSEWSSPPVLSGGARKALLRLIADPDAVVRKTACCTVAGARDNDPVLADALAAVLGDADRLVQPGRSLRIIVRTR